MSRFKILGIAAISWLPLLSMVTSAQAQIPFTSNVATDWLSTYPTSTVLAASHSATWGNAANTGGTGIWSAGQLSHNWTNVEGSSYAVPLSSNAANGDNFEILPTYYQSGTKDYLTSGATQIATYITSVPFQAYQFNPGTTLQVNMGEAMTEQVTSKLNTPGGATVTLPANWTITQGATSGLVQEVAAVERITSSSTGIGFTTTAFAPQSGSFNDGASGNSVQDAVPGVFYNYGANATSSSLAALNIPNSAGDPLYNGGSSYATVTLNPTLGPAYVAWTAPGAGTININLNAWDVGEKSGDGAPGFYVITSTAGPTAPLLSAINFNSPSYGNYDPFTGNMSATQGTLNALVSLSGFTGSAGNGGSGYGLSWQSGSIAVTSGETIYFVADDSHTWPDGHHYGSYEGAQDPLALSDIISFAPEPSSFVLMGLAGFGLALAAWKRRRSA